jgi:hypothetical protein
MGYIGIDPHKNASQICILTEDGELMQSEQLHEASGRSTMQRTDERGKGAGRTTRAD